MKQELENNNSGNAASNFNYEIIIVEDNLLANNLIQKRFRSEGIQFKVAANAKEALEVINGTKKEILLLDYKLPDITGGELVEIIRDKYHYAPNFIVMTGFGDEKIAVKMMKLGARDYIIKTNGFIDILPEVVKRVSKEIDKERELEETQLSLYKNYELLNETGRIARIGGWEIDLNSDTILFTQTIKNILNVSQNYFPKIKEFIELLSPEYRTEFKNILIDALNKRQSFNIELLLVNNQENELWVHMIGNPKMDKGKFVGLNGTFQDITQRKSSEKLMQKIDEKNKFLLKIAEDLLGIKNLPELYEYVSEKIYELIERKGFVRIIEINNTQTKWEVKKIKGFGSLIQKVQKMIGLDIENFKGSFDKSIFNILDSRKLKKTAFNFDDLSSGKINQNQGEKIKKLLGVKSLFSIPFSQNNTYMGVINIATTENNYPKNTELIEALVTEVSLSIDKFSAQDALNQNLKEKELIAKNIPNIIWKATFDPKGKIKSVYISEVVDEFLGLPQGSINNNWKKVFKHIKPKYIIPFKNKFINSFKYPEGSFSFEFEVIKANGKSGWFLASGRSYKENNEISFFGYVADISDRKRNEYELISAKNKAEESDRLKSAFLANISHEIRTPMNSISGAVSILKDNNLTENVSEINEAEKQEFFDIILKSGNRMLDTVKNIIDISKIETEQVEIKMTDINICDEFTSICMKHMPDIHTKGLKFIKKNKLSHEKLMIKSDKDKLNSVFNNLVSNAIKFTSKGYVEVGCKQQDDNVLFFVKDSGVGISEDRLNAIFNPFEQADLNLTRGYEGAGLGLSIAKSYINLLGGEIWVESKKGEGSTFCFTLPCIKHTIDKKRKTDLGPAVKKNQKLSLINGNGTTILLVEDDEISHKLMLKRLNYTTSNVISAWSGKEAVEICKNVPEIDIVLMDIKMPEMDGFEATKQIRKFNSTVPIIAQTAYALLGDKEKAFRSGFNDYLSKPIKYDQLNELIKKYSKIYTNEQAQY